MAKRGRQIVAALVTCVGLSLDLTNHAQGAGWHQVLLNLTASLQVTDWSRVLMFIGLYILFRKAALIPRNQRKWSLILPSAFFAMNMVLGFSFARTGSGAMLWTAGDGQLLKTVFAFVCWACVAYCVLKCLFELLEKARFPVKKAKPAARQVRGFHPVRRYGAQLRKHPFLTPFWTLLLLYLPLILISYPAVFMGDTFSIIVQAFPELENPGIDYLTAENVLRTGVYINQHHPALYTVCLHGFLQLGDSCFHSLNVGIFLFCLVQCALVVSAFAYASSSLLQAGVPGKYIFGMILYAAVHPQIRNFLMLVTKDSCYAACFLLLGSCMFRWRMGPFRKKEWMTAILSALGVLLFRNEGKYVLLAMGILALILDRKDRRKVLAFTAAMLTVSLGVYHVLYPQLGFTGGSVREALSVPFQQTARTVRDAPEDVSDEEKAAIDAVLDYDRLAAKYNMIFADPVKETYRESAAGVQLRTYFQTWLRMLIRHPVTYMEATYGNTYQYFYPDETRMFYESYDSSDGIIRQTSDEIGKLGKRFSLPGWSAVWKTVSDSFAVGGLFGLPVLGLLMTPSFYSWGLLVLLCWIAGRGRNRSAGLMALCVWPVLQLLIQLAGPTNGYYGRYMLPIVSMFPFLIGMLIICKLRETDAGTGLPGRTEKRKNG